MRKEHRLTRTKDFRAVQQTGRAWTSRLLTLKALPNGQELSRCGFSVSKGIGNSVTRNKVKRRLREAVDIARLLGGWDLVFIARRDSALVDYRGLKQSADSLLMRAKLVGNAPGEQGEG